MQKKWISFLFFISCTTPLLAQTQNAIWSDSVYADYIKSVQLYVDPLPLSNPVIPLMGNSVLHLAFDDLEGDNKSYYYTIIQCNFDWTTSELNPFDYLQGFSEQEIINFGFSFNTNQRFTHYDLIFPNGGIRITKSGNYILKVYLDSDPDKVVFTQRFMVFENQALIQAQIHNATLPDYQDTHQEIDFTVKLNSLNVSNPQNDVRILLMQNFRWDNCISNLTPQFIKPGELDYNYNIKNAFPGGKEFRNFDTRTIRYKTSHVQNIETNGNQTTVTLFPDPVRGNEAYFFWKDINGKFIPGITEGTDQNLQPDYVLVHFTLPVSYPMNDGKIYVMGKFCNWKPGNDCLMKYDSKTNSYQTTLYLKQGFYDYQYVFLSNKKNGDEDDKNLLEGNSYETENDYQVLVYYRPFGARYDQIVAYSSMNSLSPLH